MSFLSLSALPQALLSPVVSSERKYPVASIKLPDTSIKTNLLWEKLKEHTESALIPRMTLQLLDQAIYPLIPYPVPTAIGGLHANLLFVQHQGIAALLDSPAFVAGQYPSKGTSEAFLRYLHEHSFSAVDLTQASKDIASTGTYYPEERQTMTLGSVIISHLFTAENDGIPYYTYETRVGDTRRTILRMHFKDWPDGSAVDVLTLERILQTIQRLGTHIFVHCIAGLGRTGTVITAFLLEKMLIQEIKDQGRCAPLQIDAFLLKLIPLLRMQRGPHFIMEESQLDLIRQYGYHVLIKNNIIKDIAYLPQL